MVGSTFEIVADSIGISKSSVLNIVHEVAYLICNKLRERFIRMPSTEEEIVMMKAKFHRIAQFPMCIACVDGTHIKTQSFGGDDAEIYRNRKMYFSINCQITCTADVIIIFYISPYNFIYST